MNIKLLGALALLAMSVPAFCSAKSIRFDGGVQRDNGKPATFSFPVAMGQTTRLTLLNHTVVEFTTAGSKQADKTVIRLYDNNGKLLDTQEITGTDAANVSFRFVVCGAKATYFSPASKAPAGCPKG